MFAFWKKKQMHLLPQRRDTIQEIASKQVIHYFLERDDSENSQENAQNQKITFQGVDWGL